MTHNELLALLNAMEDREEVYGLRAVVKLHKPDEFGCTVCVDDEYPCPTIQTIEKELI